jgi:eukaryotic-like serine/threonine-protein kinase
VTAAEAARWRKVQRLVDGALDLPAAGRAEFLERSCSGDRGLHEEAARLLRSCELADATDGFLAGAASEFVTPLLAEVALDEATQDSQRRASFASALENASGGRYSIERELGRGGMATVYLARDQRHDRHVAVKVLERSITHAGAARFPREVRTAAALTHPHIVGVHDSGEAVGFLYYVMPFVDGETLQARLRRDGPLSIPDAVRLLRDVADALAYAHARGFVHRDLKPANVLLSAGHAFVTDFGIAKALALAEPEDAAGLEAQAARADLTSAGTVLGTPAYMAPEQVPDSVADARSDLYSLGVVMYEALTGAHPFGCGMSHEMLHAHRTVAPPPMRARRSDVPASLAALVMRLLAKDPSARPADASAVLQLLDGIHPTSPLAPPGPRRAAVAAAAAAFVLLAGGAYGTWSGLSGDVAAPDAVSATATAVLAAVGTVAVLPFENASGGPGDEYFSDGITDELALALARLPGVGVAGRTSSYTFKARSPVPHEVRAELGVDAFISGIVRRDSDRLFVTAQLVGTRDGIVLWSDVFESRSSDVFTVQDELTSAIVSALEPALGPGDAIPAGASRRGTADQRAYDLYLRGRYHWLERGAANIEMAIRYFQAASSRDPTFARAHAGLALAWSVLPLYVPGADSAVILLTRSAERAVALDSTLADGRVALASAYELQLRFADAERHYRAAVALEPDNVAARHFFGMFLLFTSRVEGAIAELSRAAQLDPMAKSAGSAGALTLAVAGRVPEAMTALRRILVLDSTFSIGLQTLGIIQTFAGEPDSGVATFERTLRLHPDVPRIRMSLLLAYAAAGRWPDAERVRAELRAGRLHSTDQLDAAFAEMVFGDREPLLRLLTTEEGQRLWYSDFGFGCHPFVHPLWDDPRFREAMRRRGVLPCPYTRPWPLPRRIEYDGAVD